MSEAAPRATSPNPLAERFWSIARGMEAEDAEPAAVVKHVLTILDALDRGESGAPISVSTLSFLKLLRESEQRGDLSYAAPEQICGEMLDERALVFSVGVLLFERLTGRHPFGADKQRRVARIKRGEFGSGVNYFPTVPTGLRTILMKAMGPFPEERWSTLHELRSHLEQFVAQQDRPYLPGTSSPRPSARRKTVPTTDVQPTKVVDMSDQVRLELLEIAEKKSRAHRQVAGVIEQPAAPPKSAPPPPALYALPESVDLRPGRDRLKPFVWAAAGAAVASIVLFLTRGGAADEPPPPAPVAISTPSAPAPSPPPPSPATVPPAPPAPPSPAGFDPQVTGDRAAALARTCFSPAALDRGVAFGMSLLLDEQTGRVKSVYFAGNDGATQFSERRCISQKLVTRPLADTPAPRAILGYYLRLHRDTTSAALTGKH